MAPAKSITQKIGLLAAALRMKSNEGDSLNHEENSEGEEKNIQLRCVYTSDHLLNLRNQAYCLKKPANLPDLEIILDVSRYKFNDNEEYVVSKENDRSFKEYLRVLIERGFDDTEFCGSFCQNIIAMEPKNEGNSGFKSFLNTFIEIEFEKVVYINYGIEAMQKRFEEAGDVRLKTEIHLQLMVAKNCYHNKLGIAKLIGELYRIGVLNVKVVMRAIEKLLFIGGNESLECLYWLCYLIVENIRSDCSDYVQQTGIQTDLFSFYLLKLNEYSMCTDLNAEVRAKILKLIEAINGSNQTSVSKNGSGDTVNADESGLSATFEFD